MDDETLRASDEDRERAIAVLQRAAEDGRLALGEYSVRLDSALTARTRGELTALMRDIGASAHAPTPLQAPVRQVKTILGSAERTGRWRIDGPVEVTSILGSVKLDLSQAEIVGNEAQIKVQVFLGSVDVIVPPGVQVEMEPVTILAGTSEERRVPESLPGGPRIRISGHNYLGNVSVKDPPWDWMQPLRHWLAAPRETQSRG